MVHATPTLLQAGFLKDAGGLSVGNADSVFCPGNPDELARKLVVLAGEGRRLVVRGGGKTTEGESLAAEGEALLSTHGLRKFLGFIHEGGRDFCRVEAGMTFDELERHLRPRGLELAVRPLSLSATLGGTVGIGGIDVTSWKHGTFADQVRSMQVALTDGRLVECSESEQADLFEDVIYGYGQFGVVTALTLRLGPLKPVRLERRFFSTASEAAAALVRAGSEGLADQMGVLSFNGRVNGLLLGFESEESLRAFRAQRHQWGFSEARLAADLSLRALVNPSQIPTLWKLFRLRSLLAGGLEDPLYARDGSLDFRAAAMSRVVWKVWGARPLVIPDLSVGPDQLPAVAAEALKICSSRFPLFSLYMVLVHRGPWRRRHEMGPFPSGPNELMAGIECEPLHGGGDWSPASLQAFKEEVYGLGLVRGARAYRCGGQQGAWMRRFCGEDEWSRHLERKRHWDPRDVLNGRVFQ